MDLELMDLQLKDLSYFTGSENFFYNPLVRSMGVNIVYTDGIKYVSDNGYAYLISDIQFELLKKRLVNFDFLVIAFKKNEKGLWEFTISDDMEDDKPIGLKVRKIYRISNAEKPIKMYYSNNTLLLASEW